MSSDINVSVYDLQTLYTNYINKINEKEKLNKMKKEVFEFVNSEFVFNYYKAQVKEIEYSKLIKFQATLISLLEANNFELYNKIINPS